MKTTKTIMAFLTAMAMTAGAMGITAYAEETTTVTTKANVSADGVVYEVDDPSYMKCIDEMYGYMPYEDLILKCLNMVMEDNNLHKEPHDQKWYFKHVYVDTPDFKIQRHGTDPRLAAYGITENSINAAESLNITVERGRADDIEERDGKVRRFDDIDIYWTILVADKEGLNADEITTKMKEKGLKSHVLYHSPKQFALHFDEADFTNEDVFSAIGFLNKEYNLIPGAVEHNYGTNELYYDSNYTGATSGNTFTAFNPVKGFTDSEQDKVHNDIPLEGEACKGVSYHYNPNLGILLFDGDGAASWKELHDTVTKCEEFAKDNGVYVNYVVFGRDVQHDGIDDDYYATDYPDCKRWVFEYTYDYQPFRVCTYKGSYTDKEFDKIREYVESQNGNLSRYHLLTIDDNVDAYDLLNGKVDIFDFDTVTKRPRYTVKVDNSKATLIGDADMNNEVSLSDVIVVAKFNLNRETFPIKDETALANADMNIDGNVNGLDTSALIEDQLHR